MTKKAIRESGFDAATRYNWGFHDGTNDRTQQRRQLDGAKLALNGEGYIDVPSAALRPALGSRIPRRILESATGTAAMKPEVRELIDSLKRRIDKMCEDDIDVMLMDLRGYCEDDHETAEIKRHAMERLAKLAARKAA